VTLGRLQIGAAYGDGVAEPRDGAIRLPDERALAFSEWGDPAGEVVLSFHGGGTSGLAAIGADETAGELGLRVITVDRPGFGRSDLQPGRTTLDWPGDVGALADQLGLDRYAVVGVSAGGRYALACGAAIASPRVASVGVVAGMLPTEWYPDDELIALAARDVHAARRAAREFVAGMAENIDGAVAALAERPAPDGPVYARPKVRAVLAAAYAEALRSGVEGPADEIVLTNQPWGFSLTDVATPVRWWHGSLDPLTPTDHIRRATAQIPDCELTVYEGEGHAIGFDNGPKILGRLAADLRS
jgi:pimeloyl-ACP methyl ester carboxylesterase